MTSLGTDYRGVASSAAPQKRAPYADRPSQRAALSYAAYWIVMGLSFGLTYWLSQRTQYAWYIMAQANVLLVFLFEELIPRRVESSVLRDRQSWNDLGHVLLYKLVARPLIWSMALAVVAFI